MIDIRHHDNIGCVRCRNRVRAKRDAAAERGDVYDVR